MSKNQGVYEQLAVAIYCIELVLKLLYINIGLCFMTYIKLLRYFRSVRIVSVKCQIEVFNGSDQLLHIHPLLNSSLVTVVPYLLTIASYCRSMEQRASKFIKSGTQIIIIVNRYYYLNIDQLSRFLRVIGSFYRLSLMGMTTGTDYYTSPNNE